MAEIINLEESKSIEHYLMEVSKHVKIQKAYLFGSAVNQGFSEESDIDLAIISEDFSGDQFKDNVLLGKLTWGINTRIEAVAFRPDAMHNSILGSEILKTGIELKIN